MARTIEEIKNEMTGVFISNQTIKTAYELEDGKTFAEQFSTVSIESIIFYVVAAAIWAVENLFDVHKTEVDKKLSDLKTHRLKWYRDKALAFQKDYPLPVDSDIYPTIDEAARVVKYAAAVEPQNASRIVVKIAGGDKLRDKLPDEVGVQVNNYLNWIKDAGVRIDLINQTPDYFSCEVDIYYNAMITAENVEQAVRDCIDTYIENLLFNGEYSNAALVDELQKVEGVIIPELKNSFSKSGLTGFSFTPIDARCTPEAGYFRVYDKKDVVINLFPYEAVHN